MAGQISIVLKAIDQYSGVLTGLNQGFELVSKGIAGMQKIADLAFSTINEGVELAKLGGAFQEQRNQFENLAKSYDVNGQKILDTVKRTSAFTLSEFDSITIGTKALAAGLKGQEMDDALSYVKKWSESTGQDFKSVAETVFTSMSSGRYSVLRQMGLVIEKGGKLNAVTKAMSEGLKRFGDTGFNAADKMGALNASQDDFYRKIGQGINNSEEFQSVLTKVTDTVIKFVGSFDPAPVSYFVDFMISGAKDIYKSFSTIFPQVSGVLNKIFEAPMQSAKDFVKVSIDAFYTVYASVGSVVNGIIDTLQSINGADWIGGFVKFALQSISVIGIGVSKLIGGAVSLVTKGLGTISELLQDFVSSSPSIAKALGISAEDLDFSSTINSINENISTFTGAFEAGFGDLFDKADSGLNNINGGLDKWKVNLKDIEKSHKDALLGAVAIESGYQDAGKALERITKEAGKPIYATIDVVQDDGSIKKVTTSIINGYEKALGEISKLKPEINVDVKSNKLDLSNIDKIVKGKIDAEVRVKFDDPNKKDDKALAMLSDSQILSWLVSNVRNQLVALAQGEPTPLVYA